MPRRRNPAETAAEALDARWRREEQTARNVAGLEAERDGRWQEAAALYERNVTEGFEGDWPYGRLVAAYERQAAFADAERVLERAIEVFQAGVLRTARDRRGLVAAFKRRLALVRRQRRSAERAGQRQPGGRHRHRDGQGKGSAAE